MKVKVALIITIFLFISVISNEIRAQTNIQPFLIRGTGNNHSANRVLKINGQVIYNVSSSAQRGLRLTVLSKSDFSISADQVYDTYGDFTQSDNLSTALNGITNNQIGIITSYDAWEAKVNSNLENAFLRLGLTKALATVNSGSRRPYAAIFEGASAGENSGKVVEVSFERTINQPYAEIRGHLIDGSFVALGSQPNALLRPQGDASEVIVYHNGNVGVGTGISIPTEKLVVDGKILAEEIVVQNVPQSDYVFEPDYHLLPISEVENHIKEKKHLPGIPSAEEFKENGVGLGEMDDMLLRKIEELTLYVIEQNKNNIELFKKIEELEKENDELREKVDSQEQEIKKLKNEK